MRASTTMALKRYPPLGRCLYCLAPGRELSEEHLIPRSLGGRLTLRDAACVTCQRATGRIEQLTLEREFHIPRTLLALKRRRARGRGPARLALMDGEARTSGMPRNHGAPLTAANFPRSFTLPAFEPAGHLANVDRAGAPARIQTIACRLQVGAPARERASAVRALADPHAYAYSIAKWAYGLAVAERGLDGCDTHPIRELLAGRRTDVFNFVGSAPQPDLGSGQAQHTHLHHMSLHERCGHLVLRLGLLASAGMQPYEIAIGRCTTRP